MSDDFDPGNAGCWAARGRPAHQAAALADAWQRFPDLPATAPLDDRMARTRERVAALRPLHEAIAAETEAERQRANFAHAERQVAQGTGDPRYATILHARDVLGYDWSAAYSYADGVHAARAGWEYRFFASGRERDLDQRRRAYDRGFRDGGGRSDDIFDAARRSFAAAEDRRTAAPMVPAAPAGRILPSLWPNPSDAPAPVSWQRRLIILSASEATTGAIGHLAQLQAMPGHDAAAIILVHAKAGLTPYRPSEGTMADAAEVDHLLATRDFHDILLAADDPDLDYVDRQLARLPIARNMERTRNSAIQRRAQFRIWLARGRIPGMQAAAGHIRWGKVAAGLSGRLGEFTARYAGPAEPRGHRVVIEDATGAPAFGYHSADGQSLMAEITISNKSHLRAAMTTQLRSFAAALRF
ncbi:hypothetical protein [Sphingomonas sp. YL-JM2C]